MFTLQNCLDKKCNYRQNELKTGQWFVLILAGCHEKYTRFYNEVKQQKNEEKKIF